MPSSVMVTPSSSGTVTSSVMMGALARTPQSDAQVCIHLPRDSVGMGSDGMSAAPPNGLGAESEGIQGRDAGNVNRGHHGHAQGHPCGSQEGHEGVPRQLAAQQGSKGPYRKLPSHVAGTSVPFSRRVTVWLQKSIRSVGGHQQCGLLCPAKPDQQFHDQLAGSGHPDCPVGSSARIRLGELAKALTMATRCCSPPLRSEARKPFWHAGPLLQQCLHALPVGRRASCQMQGQQHVLPHRPG